MRPDVCVRAALALALLALSLGAKAAAGEFAECDEAESLLLAPELRSEQARAGEASELVAAEHRRKLADLSAAFVDLGLHASVQASPLRLLRTAGKIGREVRDWDDRTQVEDEALTLLEPGARRGDLDVESLALYSRLERRESAARVAQLLADAETAFGAGDLRRTRRTIDRALELEPGSSHADRLLDEIDERAWRAAPDDDATAPDRSLHGQIEAWEVQLGTALLVDDFARARELGPDDANSATLGRATARYLEGDRAQALDAFDRLAGGDDAAAERAREFLADPALNPSGAFDQEVRLYRTRRALGWMGGAELAETAVPSTAEALSFSRDGYRAWQGSYRAWRNVLKPVNLVIDAPARVWRSWQPDGHALRGAAERYLELAPEGERAAEASSWLDTLGAQERQSARVSAFQDGVLVLPHAQTPWSRLSSTRIVVASLALAAAAPELEVELAAGDAPALVLALDTELGRPKATGSSLSEAASLEVLARLASGIERATLAARGDSESGVLASLRRLDARVRQGRTLVVTPWTPEANSGIDALGSALVDGERSRTIGDVELERRRETLVAERPLGGGGVVCPQQTACIELRREVDPVFFASSDSDGEVGVGARANFQDAQLSIEIGSHGPRASLVIPIARWLGIGRFVPVEARLAVGLDGISAGPERDKHAGDTPDPSF